MHLHTDIILDSILLHQQVAIFTTTKFGRFMKAFIIVTMSFQITKIIIKITLNIGNLNQLKYSQC